MATAASFRQRLRAVDALQPFRFRDFRLLWIGAVLSFTGSTIQAFTQGWLTYHITGDAAKLGLVAFLSMAPMSVFAPFAGLAADRFDKRRALIACQVVLALCALFLAYMAYTGAIRYEHIAVVALVTGMTATIETPLRQSLIATIVPREHIRSAVPIQAMTFNVARILGPVLGGLLLPRYGAAACFLANGVSYVALIFAVRAIRSDLSAPDREPQPIGDLLFEGMRYTLRDARLRSLFLMEAGTSVFGMFYLMLMPAIAKDMLGLDAVGLARSLSFVGLGALVGLALVLSLGRKPLKVFVVRAAMTAMAVAVLGMSFARSPWLAMPLFALAGMASIAQFNTTNTLFQMLAPEQLRGRVLAMHIWAIGGLTPVGVLVFSWVARQTGLPTALGIGGSILAAGAVLGWFAARGLTRESVGDAA